MNLLLHPSTQKAIQAYLEVPAQFLIITAPAGAGKLSLARYIGGELLGEKLEGEHPKVLHLKVATNKSEISIEQVRAVIAELKLATTGEGSVRRLLLIEDGHYLSEEAQNALLKTLEEPPADTKIIMTLDSPGSVLPTITSRGQLLELHPVALEQARTYFEKQAKPTEIDKACQLAEGLPGLMSALLSQSEEHELKAAVAEAKRFIVASKYERLTRANDFTKNRQQLEMLIDGLQKVVKTAQRQSILAGKKINQSRMIRARQQLDDMRDALRANVSPKTIYLNLALNLGI